MDMPTPSPTGLAALVVTCDRLGQLQTTIDRLLSAPLDRVLVIDNGPQAQAEAWLRDHPDPRIQCHRPGMNLGGAGGFALGMEILSQDEAVEWLLLMDDDGRPLPNTIDRFHTLDHTGTDAYAAAVFYPDGTVCEMNRPLRSPFASMTALFRALGRRGKGGFRLPDTAYAPDQSPTPIDMSSFVGFFVSRRAWTACGTPDPRLFLYGDDLLYTHRLTQSGLRLIFAPTLRFEHDCQTLTEGPRTYRPLWKAYYNYRNGILLYRATSGPLAWGLMALRIPAWLLASRHYGPDAPAYRRLLWAAIRDGLRGRLDSPPKDVPAPANTPN